MDKIKKAYAISNAKISFVSLVDKAANKKRFLITKAEDGSASFQSFGRIIKADSESHFVTGIVYEPMVEDSHGNYMTADEITKAAHWFMKNCGNVDIQHSFKKADGVEVVESFVAKSDMEIEGELVKQGTWLMTMEVTDADVWESIEKRKITGLSMGGVGTYDTEDVILDDVEKSSEKKGLLKKLAKAFGLEVVEKGAVESKYKSRVKNDNFYTAFNCLQSVLEGNYYNPETNSWEWGYNSDEDAIREALVDFNNIVTDLLSSGNGITKSLEKAAIESAGMVQKAGKTISAKNLETLTGIHNELSAFLNSFTPDESDEGKTSDSTGDVTKGEDNINKSKKEEKEMTKAEVQALVEEQVSKAMEPVMKQLDEVMKGDGPESDAGTPENGEASEADLEKAVETQVNKAMEPIKDMLEAICKSRALPSNLNSQPTETVEKSGEEKHYLYGII